jgi:multimeric flavodoxin WrbA
MAKRLLIVYHTLTGGSRQMAEAAQRGAAAEDVAVRIVTASDATPDDVLGADGYIFVTPENLAALAGVMKAFFDRTYYPVLDRINGRAYATLVQCRPSDRSDLYGLAIETRRGPAYRVHSRADAGMHPRAENDCVRGSPTL